MTRRTLSQRRAAETVNLRFWNQPFTVTVGFYADGRPGEVFIDGGKTGQDIQSTARDAAVVLSLAIQHGTPIETIRHAITAAARGRQHRSWVLSLMRFRASLAQSKARAMGEQRGFLPVASAAGASRTRLKIGIDIDIHKGLAKKAEMRSGQARLNDIWGLRKNKNRQRREEAARAAAPEPIPVPPPRDTLSALRGAAKRQLAVQS